jgi:flagellar hook assembly protein FlgD
MIRIYNVKGQLVKTLELGYQPAGIYTHRIRAAYWDGKNEEGARVASGVYFYQLRLSACVPHAQAGEGQFTETRKLILLK